MDQIHAEEPHPGQISATDDGRVSLAHSFGGPSLLQEVLETVLLIVIVSLALNTTTGRFQVRGSSMEPSLSDGQYLIVSKLVYWIRPPQRGDAIVFVPPNGSSDDYIKRIVGLPGELVEIREGQTWVNGSLIDEEYVLQPAAYSGSWSLREEEYLVLGDNRNNSSDSHSWGLLQRKSIVGKAWLRYWPPDSWSLVRQHSFLESADRGG